jgi:hypothetical protein
MEACSVSSEQQSGLDCGQCTSLCLQAHTDMCAWTRGIVKIQNLATRSMCVNVVRVPAPLQTS